MTIVFYISGHGFGHASRDVEVINALLARRPDLDIVVRTSAARWLIELTARGRVSYHAVECDTGIVQIDSLRLDEAETMRRAAAFMSQLPARVEEEVAWLRAHETRLVVADIPPLGVAAGAAAGIPVAALGNFTWDWIYSAYAQADGLVERIAGAYARADVAVRLPMWGGFDAFSRVIDVPFVARHATRDPRATRTALGLPLDERLVLVSFGGYGVEGIDLDALSRLEGYVALVSASVPFGPQMSQIAQKPQTAQMPQTPQLPQMPQMPQMAQMSDPAASPSARFIQRHGSLAFLDESAMYAAGFRYEDLVRAVDVVITKPGYGIIAECLANETALLYTERGHFIEYDVLVAAMPRFLRSRFIGHDDVFSANWAAHLDALLAQPAPPERPATNGAEVAADLLLEMLR